MLRGHRLPWRHDGGINAKGLRFCHLCCLEKAGEGRRARRHAMANCVIRMADLGIAVGSAVKTAWIHMRQRIM